MKFQTSEEMKKYIEKEAKRIIEWEKSLTYTDPKTGETKPTYQALHPRTFEQACENVKQKLWYVNRPAIPLQGRYLKINGGIRFLETMLQDYSPQLEVIKSKKEVYISNCIMKGDMVIIYQGAPQDIPNEVIDSVLCGADSSDNPLRPFRWYLCFGDSRNLMCVNTTSEKEIHDGRMCAFISYLKELGDPQFITIFEV